MSLFCDIDSTYKWFAKYILFFRIQNNTMIDDATTCCYGNNDRVCWETKDITRVYAIVIFCRGIYWQAALKFVEKSENKTFGNVPVKSLHISGRKV
jgi:hypothetical protein